MRGVAALLLVAFVATGLAGCSRPPLAPPDTATPAVPALADFAECDWTYPDGTPIPCSDQAAWLDVAPAPPPSAVCVHHQPNEQGPDWQLFWSPADDRHGFRVWADGQTPVDIVVRVKSGEFVGLYAMTLAADVGFVLVPDPLPGTGDPVSRNITLRFVAYHLGLAFASDNHTMTGWTQMWSLYEKQFWLMYGVETDAGDLVVPGTRTRVLERHTNGAVSSENWHEPYTMNVTGADFRLDATYDFAGFGRSPYGLNGLAPDRFCDADPNKLPVQ